MNSLFTNASQMRETSMRQPPPKKVLNVLDTLCTEPGSLNTTLFLGDLAVLCDEMNLYELFSRFGVIKTIQLKRSDRDPQRAHLGFGFVKFASHDSAQRALRETNGYFFLGRAMRVDWAADHGKKYCQVGENPKKEQTAQIHVMFVTRELNRRVSELDLGGVFSRYGNLVDVAIKKNAMSADYGVQSGYAFIHFSLTPEGLKSAITAVEEVNNLIIDKIAYQCKVTHTLQMHLWSLKKNEPVVPMNHYMSTVPSNFPSHQPAYTSLVNHRSPVAEEASSPVMESTDFYDRMNHHRCSLSRKPFSSPSSYSFSTYSSVEDTSHQTRNTNMMYYHSETQESTEK